jgi:hypothetical protein
LFFLAKREEEIQIPAAWSSPLAGDISQLVILPMDPMTIKIVITGTKS